MVPTAGRSSKPRSSTPRFISNSNGRRRSGSATATSGSLRDDMERATTIRYILDNPVEAGLATDPADYPFLGSQSYTVAELVQQAAPSP